MSLWADDVACELRGGHAEVFAESVEVLSSSHLVDELFFGDLARLMLANDTAAAEEGEGVTDEQGVGGGVGDEEDGVAVLPGELDILEDDA